MKQRRLQVAGIVLIGVLVLGSLLSWPRGACGKSEGAADPARVIIILVDMSGSANQARRTVYKEAFEKIYQNLAQGDRLMVGAITARSYIDFKPTVDVEIPKKSIWDNRLQFERTLSDSKEKIRRGVNKLLNRKQGTPLTEILNSLNIADTIFHEEKERRKILVILSDMIQDSKEYKFDKDKITKDYADAIIRLRRQNNLVPALAGVKVYVAGASAADSDRFRSVQAFWTRYFAASGADFSAYRYGHSLIRFENGS